MQLTLFLGIYYYKCRQKFWIWVVGTVLSENMKKPQQDAEKTGTSTEHTFSHTTRHAYEIIQPLTARGSLWCQPQQTGSTLKNQTKPTAATAVSSFGHSCNWDTAGWTSHTKPPRRDTSSWLHSTDIVVYPSIKWLNKLRQPSDIFVCHVGLLLKPFQAACIAKMLPLRLEYIWNI